MRAASDILPLNLIGPRLMALTMSLPTHHA
jgi:hypothetical protein